MENLFTLNKIRLYSGVYFDPFEPDIDLIKIEDIAHGLSLQCRFGGHTQNFFSACFGVKPFPGFSTYNSHSNCNAQLSAFLIKSVSGYWNWNFSAIIFAKWSSASLYPIILDFKGEGISMRYASCASCNRAARSSQPFNKWTLQECWATEKKFIREFDLIKK